MSVRVKICRVRVNVVLNCDFLIGIYFDVVLPCSDEISLRVRGSNCDDVSHDYESVLNGSGSENDDGIPGNGNDACGVHGYGSVCDNHGCENDDDGSHGFCCVFCE